VILRRNGYTQSLLWRFGDDGGNVGGLALATDKSLPA